MKSYTWEWKKNRKFTPIYKVTSKILSRILSISTYQPSILGKVLFVVIRVSERNRSNSLERRLESIAFNSTDPDQPSFLVTKTISKNEGKKKKHTWTQKKTWGSPSAQVWLDDVSKRDWRFIDSTHPTPLPHRTSRGPNHEMAAWKGGMNWNFICKSTHLKEYHYKTKSYMSQGAWPGCIFVQYKCISIFLDICIYIYIGLCIYQKYIYICIHIPTWTPWARWEWFEFLLNLCDVEVVLGIISLEHRNVLGFWAKNIWKFRG